MNLHALKPDPKRRLAMLIRINRVRLSMGKKWLCHPANKVARKQS